MTPVRLEKATSLRATVRILAWILFVITGITLLTFALRQQEDGEDGGCIRD